MKRLFIHIILLVLVSAQAWADTDRTGKDSGLTSIEANTTTKNSGEKASLQDSKVTLHAYSMNSVLFIETDATAPVSIYSKDGELIKEVTPNGNLIVLPLASGEYIIRVHDLTRKVVVK